MEVLSTTEMTSAVIASSSSGATSEASSEFTESGSASNINIVTFTYSTTIESTEQSSSLATSKINTDQSSTAGAFSTEGGTPMKSSSFYGTGYTSSYIDVTEMILSDTTRLQTLLSSVPVVVFTSTTYHTTTICHTFPRELFTSINSETTSLNTLSTQTTTPFQDSLVSIIRSNQSNASEIANALIAYFNQTIVNEKLTPDDIDYAVSRLNISVNVSVENGLIMSQKPLIDNRSPMIGAVFLTQSGGKIVVQQSSIRDVNANISVGGIYSLKSFDSIDFLRILLIDKPIEYLNVTDTLNRKLASSVVVANLQSSDKQLVSGMNISLYFRARKDFVVDPTKNVDFFCSFYDSHTASWNESGCSMPVYNSTWDRYECNCNHLTSFALIWLPKTSESGKLTAQDIASLVFQSISIICFLAVIIHVIYTRITNPVMSLQAKDLLPLVSTAVTMILFIFYIALTLTVFMSPESKDSQICFLNASILMFFVYFLLILMFCIKTSVAYFNYINFVHLFPPASFKQLYTFLITSFFISITYVAFAAGFNSNSSLGITQLYAMKICWFTRRVIHYFVTIPICLCLILNIYMLLLVGKRLVDHLRRSKSPHGTYERMKRCVLVLIASCITQGIGWLFGLFLPFVDEQTADILGWFFVVFNAFEGFWTLMLYILIQRMRIHEQRRLLPARALQRKEQSKVQMLSIGKQHNNEDILTISPVRIDFSNMRKISPSMDGSFDAFHKFSIVPEADV
ncbi:unnamed protein product [Rotaria socialis]|uniref:G-protein coupled receptors family 2 profile 2 domain-containing protein n=1 Tax=Rotaria socialis TaxID=392032 RepID=A0A818NPI8_9BILA|nr:unnamed protein product [Rotaria socialis]CAF4909924.1 unnamed protein product [Rotaria socialis]